MKRSLFVCHFSLCIYFVQAQLPFIGTTTVIPQNPTPADFIKIVTHVTTPNQGILVDIAQTVTPNLIKLRTCYWQGMVTTVEVYTDTFMIGQLPAGNYQIDHKAYMSTTQQWCNKTDSNAVITSFGVAAATGIYKNSVDDLFEIYPNPTSRKISLQTHLPLNEIFIFSSSGTLVYKKERPDNNEIDLNELPEGLYFIRMIAGDKTLNSRIIKNGVD